MSERVIKTRPVNKGETLLRQKFVENVAGQSDLMDQLARQLIALELAIPGLYATVLKLTQGNNATITVNGWFYLTLFNWSLALLLTLASLIPRNWRVDPTMLDGDTDNAGADALSIKAFFEQSARHKRRLLIPACCLFWCGVVSAFLVVL